MIFENVMSPFVKITHEGNKKRVGRKLYYAPNLYGMVSGKSHVTYEELVTSCKNCSKHGHYVFTCPEEPKCFRCRRPGHKAYDCPGTGLRDREPPLLPTIPPTDPP